MKFIMKKVIKIFDQVDKYNGITNVLGMGDPHVVKLDNQWWMFFGGFQTNFKNNIFTATLPIGEPLSNNNWTITRNEQHSHKAKALTNNSPKGEWDSFGYHTPCYVKGIEPNGAFVERVYYAGRGSNKVVDNNAPYAIGFLEKKGSEWFRHPLPVITGTEELPNVLEPNVRFIEGMWRMWYVTTKQETGKNGFPQYRILYSESKDGLSNWSKPQAVFIENENFYNASVHPSNNAHGFEMVVCRSTNLYGRTPFPKQGLWILEGKEANGDRINWSESPRLILDSDKGPEWYRNGVASPIGHYGESEYDQDTLYLFFTGLHKQRNWLRIALYCLKHKKSLPFPSPFYFSVGKLELKKVR
ncbi:hypothetical protein F9279_14180 [Bacillus sp. B1-b2]|nr:hypothetical protein F9279_14180 [Bacillus sp. B1-b2]